MKNRFLKSVLTATLLIFHLPAPAADIDLYTNLGSSSASDLPNVLFIIDNTANWSTAFTNEISALATTFANLPENQFNIGVMFSAETSSSDSNISGGYVRAALRPMTNANKAKYSSMISSLDVGKDKGNSGVASLTMAEAYRYLTGGVPYAGNNKAKADYAGNTGADWSASATSAASLTAMKAIYALSGNALTSKSASTYHSPIASGSCGKNYIIFISNGASQDNNTVVTQSNAMLTAAGGNTTTIPLTPSGSQGNPSDEWARFMHSSSLGVVTYTIDIDPATSGQGPGWTKLLKSMADISQGTYTAVSSTGGSTAIAKAVTEALSKIQSVNSVFAAVSLPANANVQGAYLNQFYIGMFRPDPDTKPRWKGNLKQYELGSSNQLVDADGADAIGDKGFISECARSYWTPLTTATDSYWVNDPKGSCIPPGTDPDLYKISNTPDGDIVEKGAQAYVLRSGTPGTRTVKTCSASFAACTALVDFTDANVSTANLGAADSAERDLLINWAKGQNVDAELGKATSVMRPSSHGDVIHSNPLALSYGADVVVFYGSNDGMLHAINGNKSSNGALGVVPGGELWAFMPPEFFGSIKRLRDNTPLVSVQPQIGNLASGSPKPYAIDGPISTYKDSTRAWVYATMRRGGRALYAFDVTTPTSPLLKWKIGCPNLANDTDCLAGFTGIGQTWSLAQPVKAAGYSSGTAPLLIMGGGYDNCEDADPNTCTAAAKGRSVFVLDADTGTLLKTLSTDRGVVGDVKVVPDTSGRAKYAYAADLGGNLYRINIGTAAPADWTITKIASLGCATAAACTDNRKFMFAPSVVPETDGSYSIFIGSGDREKPLGSAYYPHASAVQNRFFKVIDKPADATWLSSEAAINCPGQSLICLNSLLAAGSSASICGTTVPLAESKGWVLGLRATEQVVTPASTRFGVTTFSTHMPAVPVAGTCASNLGTAHVYNIVTATATPVAGTTCSDEVTGGGLAPPPQKKDICMNSDCSDKRSICIGCGKKSSIGTGENNGPPPIPNIPGQNAKRRVYWYIQK
jgi:type IV pilus assembly protein PilY1